MKEIWRNLDGPPKNKDLWIYVVKFEARSDHTRYQSDLLLNLSDYPCSLHVHEVERLEWRI